MKGTATFPRSDHDHANCVAAILTDAEDVCAGRKVRLTLQRRRVLEIVAESHAAIGAYEILEHLARGGKRPAPVTVYRALDFLMAHGLVHRLASLNAYIACPRPGAHDGAQFLICKRCGTIGELCDRSVHRAIANAASDVGFAVSAPVVEVAGLCLDCRHDGRFDAA
jgi:Fur family zinc uptake transcriptional regulator